MCATTAVEQTVAAVGQSSTADERCAAYRAEVTYAPVSEVGFDVLRDRLVLSAADVVVTPPAVAIVDEADAVMIDDARVPLVLAGAAERAEANRRWSPPCAGCAAARTTRSTTMAAPSASRPPVSPRWRSRSPPRTPRCSARARAQGRRLANPFGSGLDRALDAVAGRLRRRRS